jgi:cytochrome d ubiquinol oxidase subunit II
MPLEELAAAVVLLGLIAYAMFGGADFGGGVWTALAVGPRAAQQRDAIFRAMGPVWETNHVWLILIIVTLFTAFPPAFADLFTALLVPLVIALVGIVFRGAAFAFRHYGGGGETGLPATGLVFSVASVATPAAMGMALGAVAGGHVTIDGGEVTSGLWEPWLQPFSILCGGIAVTICAFLTAYYMTTRTAGELREDFRNRGLAASLTLGALTTIAIPVANWDAPLFWDELVEPGALAVIVASVTMGLASLLVLWRRWYLLAPPVAAGTVALVIVGWGAVQYPYLILPDERISDVAAGDATLTAFLISLPIGALILVPSLVLLFLTFREKTGGPGIETERYEH